MEKSNIQRMVGAMSATSFIALLQILGKAEPLPTSLRVAVWCFAASIPFQAAAFSGDVQAFEQMFFSKVRHWPKYLIGVSTVFSVVGLSCLFFYFGTIFGATFLLVGLGSLYGLTLHKEDDPPGPDAT